MEKQNVNLKITSKKGADINEGMFGLFFEDINYAADGGLYAEYIENRSFEFLEAKGDKNAYYQEPAYGYGWEPYGSEVLMSYETEAPLNEINPHYLRFVSKKNLGGFSNKAYDGIHLVKGEEYRVSFYARSSTYDGNILVFIKNGEENAAEGRIAVESSQNWTKYELEFKAENNLRHGKFVICLEKPGNVDFDFISMFPKNALCGVFRKDLTELLKDMKPGFLRFPGGCVVEGNELSNRYQWKQSVGPVEERKANWNRWAVHGNCEENNFSSEFRFYNQTLGLGYYEYFLLCETIGAKPLPVVNVGLACQYQSQQLVEITDAAFETYVEDALDLIEFANGGVDTAWGKLRCQMGHEKPFNLELLGIGNEQWQTERVDFFERYTIFEKRIHEKYPEIKLIGSAGPAVKTKEYDMAWEFYRKKAAENQNFAYAVDEHYYMEPKWFYENADFYDSYDRKVKVFSGEYAAHPADVEKVEEKNNFEAALSEAAFLTGVERNADVVILASYAPLFARIGYVQWSPDMIWFDDASAYGTPSYYVQKMYSLNMGNYILESRMDEEKGLYQSVSYDETTNEYIIKLVNAGDKKVCTKFHFDESVAVSKTAKLSLLSAPDRKAANSLSQPTLISAKTKDIDFSERTYTLPKESFVVLRCPKEN